MTQKEALNMNVRKFLKKVGVQSQRDIETAVLAGLEDGRITENDVIKASVTLTIGSLVKPITINGDIMLKNNED